MDPQKINELLLWSVAFIFSTTLHEAAHAWVAYKGGDSTAYEGGQVTLNPLPHIQRSPFGMVIVPILCFFISNMMIGWASTPYNRNWAIRHPHRSALMSLAGPAANCLLMVLSFAGLKAGISAGLFHYEAGLMLSAAQGSLWDPLAALLSVMFTLNLILMVFNLIPFPPLDGAESLLLLFPEHKAEHIRDKMAAMGMFGLLIAWLVFNKISTPIILFAWHQVLS